MIAARQLLLLIALFVPGTCQHAGHDRPEPSSSQAEKPSAPPVKPSAPPVKPGAPHGEHVAAPPARTSDLEAPPGYAMFDADLARLTALGLETTTVEQDTLERTIRTVGIVSLDETRTAHVHTKVKGFVEAIHADFVGKKVRRGEALVSIFSQEVVAAQLEYVALANSRRAVGESIPQGVLDAAKRRVSQWDVPPRTLDDAEKNGKPSRWLTIVAPRAGTIVSKRAVQGTYVEPGSDLYTISDLSRLWVQIDLYEADVAKLKLGQEVELQIEGIDLPIRAPVTFLAPTIDEATRTVRARIDVTNDAGSIRPGAFVTATFRVGANRALVVPASAIVRTGLRDLAFVVSGSMIHPREVKLGPLVAGRYRVDSGLVEGEKVATGAQFLIDAESRLRASSAPGPGHGGH